MGFLHFNRNRNTGVFVSERAVLPIFSSSLILKTGLQIKKM